MRLSRRPSPLKQLPRGADSVDWSTPEGPKQLVADRLKRSKRFQRVFGALAMGGALGLAQFGLSSKQDPDKAIIAGTLLAGSTIAVAVERKRSVAECETVPLHSAAILRQSGTPAGNPFYGAKHGYDASLHSLHVSANDSILAPPFALLASITPRMFEAPPDFSSIGLVGLAYGAVMGTATQELTIQGLNGFRDATWDRIDYVYAPKTQ